MSAETEALWARIDALEKRVALLEKSEKHAPALPTPYIPVTAHCPFCSGHHPGMPCPVYIVTCDNSRPGAARGV